MVKMVFPRCNLRLGIVSRVNYGYASGLRKREPVQMARELT